MDRFTSLEAFVVGVEDHTTLLRLYLERLRRAPHNPAYHLAVCEHTDELLTAVRELHRDQNNLSPHTREGVEALLSLAEAGAALALRLASFAPEQQTSALDGLTQATTCFVDMVRTMSDTGRVIEVSLTHQITQRLQGFLAAPLSATPDTNQQTRRITTEVTFDGNEDPFDDLAVDLDDDFLDDVIGSLEGAFDAATHPTSEFALPEGVWQSETEPGVPAEVRQLFADIATGYVQPIKDFITELRKGAFARDWLEACRPAVVNLRRASQSIAFTDLSIRLERLEAVLLQDHSEGDRRRYGRHWKLRVLSAYADLEDYLPATFFIPPAPTSSESIVLTTLLKQVEGVGQKKPSRNCLQPGCRASKATPPGCQAILPLPPESNAPWLSASVSALTPICGPVKPPTPPGHNACWDWSKNSSSVSLSSSGQPLKNGIAGRTQPRKNAAARPARKPCGASTLPWWSWNNSMSCTKSATPFLTNASGGWKNWSLRC